MGVSEDKAQQREAGKIEHPQLRNWSSSIYSVSKVIPRRNTIAEKYSVKGKDADLKYSRNDLKNNRPAAG